MAANEQQHMEMPPGFPELWEGVTGGDGVGSWGRGQGSIYLTGVGGSYRAVSSSRLSL